jgi:hypothetical protein
MRALAKALDNRIILQSKITFCVKVRSGAHEVLGAAECMQSDQVYRKQTGNG